MNRTVGTKLLTLLAIVVATVALTAGPAAAAPAADAKVVVEEAPESLITPEQLLTEGLSFTLQNLGGVESQSCFGNCTCDSCNCSSGCSLSECQSGCNECFEQLRGGCQPT